MLNEDTAEERARIFPVSGVWPPASLATAIGAIDGTHLFYVAKLEGGAGRPGDPGQGNLLTPFMRVHGKFQGPSVAINACCDALGRLLWASRVHPGATADITIVRKDKLAEAFVLRRPGLPETHGTFLGDHGYGGLGNVEKEGSDQCVLVPVPKKQIKTEADREYSRRPQHERAPIECFWGRMHDVAGAMPQPLKASFETAGLHLRGILAVSNRSLMSNPLTADETRAHRAWQAERAGQIAAGAPSRWRWRSGRATSPSRLS
jgi:hypothetical protein